MNDLQPHHCALLRRWLWVRAPPNPNFYLTVESPRSHCGGHSAGGEAQSIDQVHTVVCCILLLFFWVALADLTLLTAVWCTSQYFTTLLASSREPMHLTSPRLLGVLKVRIVSSPRIVGILVNTQVLSSPDSSAVRHRLLHSFHAFVC
jgi:hypothetical protein